MSIDPDPHANRVVESNFPDVIHVDRVEDVTLGMCQEWAGQASNAKLVLVGAGPPCQGVSSLNCR